MKTNIMTLSALAVLVGLASCSKEETNSHAINTESVKVSLFAEQENGSTRAEIGTTTDGKTTILWSKNDSLSVFDGDNKNIKFKLASDARETSGTFEGEVSTTSDSYIALYPYQKTAAINTERNTISSVVLKSEQTATDGSFDPTAALMVAKESGRTLTFKNVVGYVKVTPEFACKKISLVSKNTEDKLAGTVSISIDSEGTPTATIASDASDASYTVSIEGNINANTTYYIAVIPTTMSGGFKLTFTDNYGDEHYKETSNTLEIKKSTITNLGSSGSISALTPTTPYVTFSAASEQVFKMKLASSGIDNTFEYSVGGTKWETVESENKIPFGGTNGDLRLRGKSSAGTATSTYSGYFSRIFFTEDVKVSCSGDIRTLIDYTDYKNAKTSDARFCNLFYSCKNLTSIPENLLPATNLATSCYAQMFSGCTGLTSIPEKLLPATNLASQCYYSMFYNCTGLTSIPGNLLPATTLTNRCYYQMFYGCTGLTSIPENLLPATNLASSCYNQMFRGTKLTSIPKNLLPATTLADECYSLMFYECSKLSSIPEKLLQATNLASSCYNQMFRGCTGLSSIPEKLLPATTLASSCYKQMFGGTGLTSIPEGLLQATTLANQCYYLMFSNCAELISIPENLLQATELAVRCYYQMFEGCTRLTSIPQGLLPATTLADYCYSNMFSKTGLTSIPETLLQATNLKPYCYASMFKECSGLTTIALKLPAETLADYCYQDMFRTCINLQTAPVLPATTLAEYCYSRMFYECTKLQTAPVLPAETLAKGCYQEMFNTCTSLTKVVLRATEDGYLQTATENWLLNTVPSSSDGKIRTLYKASDISLTQDNKYGYPTGWTIKALSELTD